MSFFEDYAKQTDGRLLQKWSHYFAAYDRELTRFRNRPIRFLEIGIDKGGSLPMWKAFFHPDSTLVFIDINPDCAALTEPGTHIEIGDQADPAFLDHLVATYGSFDVVLDDGSHRSEHQIATLTHLWPHLSDGGVYMVEDTHCSYWQPYGGGLRKEGSFIEYAKTLVDLMHYWYVRDDEEIPFDPRVRELESVRFYDSIVVMEKYLRRRPPGALYFQDGKVVQRQMMIRHKGRMTNAVRTPPQAPDKG